jgi:hypothetical protein
MKDPRGQRPPRVVWKAEDRDASGVAYGPVWIDTFDADGKVSGTEKLPDWLTADDAAALARERGADCLLNGIV